MKKQYVTCLCCNEKFDRNAVPALKIGRRYIHESCKEKYEEELKQKEQQKKISYLSNPEDEQLSSLEEYIKKIFDIPYISQKIKRQIQTYIRDYNYSYEGIFKTLFYWYGLKGKSIEKANNGLGIVPYIYDESQEYFKRINMAKEKNEIKNLDNYKIEKNIIEIPPPKADRKRIKLFNLDE
jgi:hypothetical protein